MVRQPARVIGPDRIHPRAVYFSFLIYARPRRTQQCDGRAVHCQWCRIDVPHGLAVEQGFSARITAIVREVTLATGVTRTPTPTADRPILRQV